MVPAQTLTETNDLKNHRCNSTTGTINGKPTKNPPTDENC